MACEGCAIKFTLFKRKKQCDECLRHYCTNCLTRCPDRRLNCGKCRVFSQRPLIRTHLLEMRSKDLQHYLMVKKISTRGCAEKEDLVNLIIQHANSTDGNPTNQRTSTGNCNSSSPLMNAFYGLNSTMFTYSNFDLPNPIRQETRHEMPSYHRRTSPDANTSSARVPESRTSFANSTADYSNNAPNSRSRSPPGSSRVQESAPTTRDEPTPIISLPETENASSASVPPVNVEIEEVSDSDCSPTASPEPLITEQEESSTTNQEKRSEMVMELLSHTGIVKLSDISDPAGLAALNVKQLKDLLAINRVDFRGCVERSELLEKASRLWKQHAKSREDLEKLGLEDLCKICMDAPIECVMLECGHMATCTNCGKQLSECPICRQYVIRVVRTFRA